MMSNYKFAIGDRVIVETRCTYVPDTAITSRRISTEGENLFCKDGRVDVLSAGKPLYEVESNPGEWAYESEIHPWQPPQSFEQMMDSYKSRDLSLA